MLKGEDVICGTSTTGTGTLTLAQTPAPPGGADFFQWLTASGVGFTNGAVVLVPYIIKEHTDSTFSTISKTEVGWGTLTLGASLTATTLARTTVQSTVTNENTSAATYSTGNTAITIGTAANVLVFIGPRAMDTIAFTPYYETTLGDNIGITGLNTGFPATNTSVVNNPGGVVDHYWVISIGKPILIKRATMRVNVAFTGSSTINNAYFRLYDMDTTGRPGRLLCDYGLLGPSSASMTSIGNIGTAVHATGLFATPGDYVGDLFVSIPSTTITSTPAFAGLLGVNSNEFGLSSNVLNTVNVGFGGSSVASATASLVGYNFASAFTGAANNPFRVALKSS
jgi:hypothetical protein